jgi:hypothetical protein
MYMIIRYNSNYDDDCDDYFGPFPTADRANKYAESFEQDVRFRVVPLIVPNCVQVKLVY